MFRNKNAPVQRADVRFRHSDGSWRTFEVVASNLIHDNVIEAVIINLRDMTERNEMEGALRQSEEKYRTILESIEEGYFEVDLAGNFTFFNDTLCPIMGYSREELVGMNNRQYIDKEELKKVFKAYNKVYKTGKPNRGFRWQIKRKDGTKRYIEGAVSLLKDSSGNPSGFRGITEFSAPVRHVKIRIADDLEDIADSRLISIALENLMSNAWKFTAKQSDALIEFGSTYRDGSKKVYFIRDNGAGFDMTYMDKLFARFQRLHTIDEYPGTGIGLATVRRIIHRHGGKVWAEGQTGKGATFYFSIHE